VLFRSAAFQENWVDVVPPPTKTVASEPVWLGVVVVRWRDQVLLQPPKAAIWPFEPDQCKVARADFSGLHQGMWSLPGTVWLQGQTAPEVPVEAWVKWLGLPKQPANNTVSVNAVGEFRHAITTFRLKVSVYEYVIDGKSDLPKSWRENRADDENAPRKSGVFFAQDQGDPPISQLTRKALEIQMNAIS